MPRVLWLDRTWDFGFSADLYPSLLERLRGTPARLEELVRNLARGILVHHSGSSWSIQENIGHLVTLEALPAARLADFLSGAERLTAWEGNQADDEAGHDTRDLSELLDEFRLQRSSLVSKLDALSAKDFVRTALHPRLGTPLRLVDMCLFHADHDDHHLARISELKRARS